jgi:lipid A 3-O-deacylase
MPDARRGLALVLLLPVSLLASGTARAQSDTSGLDLGPLRLEGDGPSYLDFGVGAFDIQGHPEAPTAPEGRVEFRYGGKFLYIGPALGLVANTQGGVFGYGGFYSDIALGHFVLTPLGAVGGYHRGGSEDLGGTFQFRLSAELAYEFDNRSRMGVNFAHISNAGIHNRNPGDNELLLIYALPLPF